MLYTNAKLTLLHSQYQTTDIQFLSIQSLLPVTAILILHREITHKFHLLYMLPV